MEFREKVMSGAPLAGTFVKTPAIEVIEVLAKSGLDFVCLDAEHSPWDRARMDQCVAIGRALGFPVLVRVEAAVPHLIMQALDSGAEGVVVPHVTDAAAAQAMAKAARFGHGGRGYAGSTRSAGFGTSDMPTVLSQGGAPLMIAQIEDPEALDACEEIAATEGVDAVFFGPSDMSVALGVLPGSETTDAARRRVGAAARAHGRACMTFVANAEAAAPLRAQGYSVFFIASEHAWMLAGARAAAAGIHDA